MERNVYTSSGSPLECQKSGGSRQTRAVHSSARPVSSFRYLQLPARVQIVLTVSQRSSICLRSVTSSISAMIHWGACSALRTSETLFRTIQMNRLSVYSGFRSRNRNLCQPASGQSYSCSLQNRQDESALETQCLQLIKAIARDNAIGLLASTKQPSGVVIAKPMEASTKHF